ncbi:MAG: response regulator [Spirochaetes bacterium]|nr:response regulator [Spirochaetota bacterium]
MKSEETTQRNDDGFIALPPELAVLDKLNIPVCVISKDGTLIARNKEFIRLFDIDRDQIRINLNHSFSPEDRRKVAISYLRALRGQKRQCTATIHMPNGDRFALQIFLYPMSDGKDVISILVFLHVLTSKDNVTTNFYSENKKSSVSKIPAMYEFLPFPLLQFHQGGKLLYGNAAAENFFGWPIAELKNDPRILLKTVSDYDLQRIKKSFQEINNGQAVCKRISEIKVMGKGDTERWMNVVMYPILRENGTVAVEMVIEDITKIKQLEQKVTLMSRIRVLSDITKGLLHSFNNLINIVLSRTQLLLQITEKDSVLEGLRVIERTAEEGVRQVKRIAEFIGEGEKLEESVEASLIDILEDAAEFAKLQQKVDEKENRRIVTMEKVYYSKATVKTDIKLLRELLLSIIFKVSQFIKKEGKLSITLKNNGSPVVYVKAHSFTDTAGYDATEMGILFRSTDVRLLAEKINIRIIEEESPHSYAIQAVIPASMVVEKKKEVNDSFVKIRGLNVMIVEDQEELRDVLQEMFSNMGNRVTVFGDGHAALEDFKAKQYDLLISDYGLKGITGLELATKIKEIDENVVTVLLSGWMIRDLRAHKNVVDAFFEKPFKLDDLIKGIARILALKKK